MTSVCRSLIADDVNNVSAGHWSGGAGVEGVCSDWDHQEWDVTSLIWADRQLQLTTAALTTIALNRYNNAVETEDRIF